MQKYNCPQPASDVTCFNIAVYCKNKFEKQIATREGWEYKRPLLTETLQALVLKTTSGTMDH
jgi:hypothetical protein